MLSIVLWWMQDETGPSADAANLVRQLVCAAIHSKAAYGHAMAAGYLSSLYNFALLQTVKACGTLDLNISRTAKDLQGQLIVAFPEYSLSPACFRNYW